MNKKLLALLLAILMVAMSAVAMADATSVPVTKNIAADAPTETFSFTSEVIGAPNGIELAAVPSLGSASVTVEDGETSDTGSYTLPAATDYPAVGIYKYRVSETAPNTGATAGVTYDTTTTYEVWVTIYNGTAGFERSVGIHSIGTNDDGKPTDTKATAVAITNSYAAYNLTVSKTVTGSSADLRDQFEITVTFSNPTDGTVLRSTITPTASTNSGITVNKDDTKPYTYTITGIGNGENVVFSNIPAGVQYTVAETNKAGSVSEKTYVDTYTVNGEATNGTVSTTIASTGNTVVVTNTLSEDLDTGVSTDTMPYILLMAFVAILAVAFVARKRSVNE